MNANTKIQQSCSVTFNTADRGIIEDIRERYHDMNRKAKSLMADNFISTHYILVLPG